ncbi:MAG: hypothetical protein ACI4DK_06135, partial [Lachnospiraceae bacterium]
IPILIKIADELREFRNYLYYDYENAICNCVPVRELYAHFTSNNHLTKFINQIYGGKEHEQRRSMEPIDRIQQR